MLSPSTSLHHGVSCGARAAGAAELSRAALTVLFQSEIGFKNSAQKFKAACGYKTTRTPKTGRFRGF